MNSTTASEFWESAILMWLETRETDGEKQPFGFLTETGEPNPAEPPPEKSWVQRVKESHRR